MTIRKAIPFVLFLSFSLIIFSCGSQKKEKAKIDKTITPETSYNNLFLDSAEIHVFIEKDTEYKDFEAMYVDFYRQRNFEFAWFDTSGLIEQAGNFVNLLNNDPTSVEDNDSSISDKKLQHILEKYKRGITRNQSRKDIIQAELTLTGEFFKNAQEVFKGKGNIDAEQLGWFIPRKKIDFAGLLDSTLSGKEIAIADFLNPQFKKLRAFLQKYIDLKKADSWDSIGLDVPKLKLNDSNTAVQLIQHRLYLLGDLDEDIQSDQYDKATEEGVINFQKRYGLSPDGVVGPNFMKALNIPIDTLIRDITVNLERVRWIPAELPKEYIWVNIPDYKLDAYQNGEKVFSMRVIVGSAAHGTTIFSGNIKYVVFAPYWNVPRSIVLKEILPGIKNDPDYIRKHNMEVTGYNQGIPDVRQLPGPDNALGRVKFLFPNSYNIYLHDTPNHDLFTSRNRGLSHGCVRLSDPEKMADWLLRDDSVKYSKPIIDSLMNKNVKEKWVTLEKTVPVYLVYFTSWVDEKGRLNIRKDIYGHDAIMANKLFSY